MWPIFNLCVYQAFREMNLSSIVDTYLSSHQLVNLFSSHPVSFFLISGFLYFLNVPVLTQSVYKRKTRSRWHTLILSYILWNIIALVYLTLVAMARTIIKVCCSVFPHHRHLLRTLSPCAAILSTHYRLAHGGSSLKVEEKNPRFSLGAP